MGASEGEGTGEGQGVDGGSAGFFEAAGAGIEGGAGGHDVVDEEEGVALYGAVGAAEAIGGFGVKEARFPVEAGLGADVGFNALKEVFAAGEREGAGKVFGEDLGLVVAAGEALPRGLGHGDNGVEGEAEGENLGLPGGEEKADEVVGEPEAAAILEGLDEGAEGVFIAGGYEGAGVGGAEGGAAEADEVFSGVGFGGFEAADFAVGVAVEGKGAEAVGAEVTNMAGALGGEADRAAAENTVGGIGQVYRPA